jgi:hypothetical protein
MNVSSLPLFLMFEQFWNHKQVGQLVSPFLVLMHQVVRASVPLMETACLQASQNAKSCKLSRLLADYLEIHIEEEQHHDVWILEDLGAAGLDEQDVLSLTPPASVASMVGAQYYWILHHHPVAHLGYIRLLEGNPPSMAHIERLKHASGLPDAVFRTYRLHGELDPDHLQEFDDMLDTLPLTDSQAELIATSAKCTANHFATCLAEIMTRIERSA